MTQMATENTEGQTFHCETFHLKMPVEKQRNWCAVQFRKGREHCLDCDLGKAAAKDDREDVRSGLPSGDRRTNGWKNGGITTSHKEVDMAEKKLCSCGVCGKGAVKDGLSTKCYRKKYGKVPFPKGPKKPGRSVGRYQGFDEKAQQTRRQLRNRGERAA